MKSDANRAFRILRRESLCCFCALCEGKCEWSHDGVPMTGWNAEARRMRSHVRGMPPILSYHVFACPCFQPDRGKRSWFLAKCLASKEISADLAKRWEVCHVSL